MTDDDRITVPAVGITTILSDIRNYGVNLGVETGGFLLAPRGHGHMSVLALTGDEGITRRRDQFQISALALERLFTFADERDLWVPVQYHSHGIGAFLSRTDKEHGLCVEGFISVVVPFFRNPPITIESWGWWTFSSGRWVEFSSASTGDGDVSVMVFDEDGMRES